jgi:hypothetical protein
MLSRIKDKVKQLVGNHGPEITTCVKIAAHALIPGGGVLVETVGALCDYTNEKSKDISEDEVLAKLESLGNDQIHLLTLIEHLTREFGPTVDQMSNMARYNVPDEALESIVNGAIAQNPALMEIRDQMMALQPELETIQRQNEEMLRNQNLQGDMLEQVKDSVDAALAFVNPMQAEGLSGRAASEFMAKECRFQLTLLNGDFGGAQTALDEMKSLSPHGNRVKICEMALKTSQKKFDDAE